MTTRPKKACELYPIVQANGVFRWKWRHSLDDGRLIESTNEFSLYYECVLDARAHGYAPEIKCT